MWLSTHIAFYTWGYGVLSLGLLRFLFISSPFYPSLRYVLILKTTLRLWHHTLCLIALMWAILGIGSRAFWLWWTRSYGMTPHWGISTSKSFYRVCNHFAWYIALGYTFFGQGLIFFRWPLCRGILLSFGEGFFSHGHPSEEIRCPFSHWSMRHDWYISFGILYTRAYPS